MKGLIFTYALTAAGTLGSFLDPYYGLLVYITFAIVKPDAMWYWSVPSWNYSRVVAVAMLLSWAAHGFGNLKFGQGRRLTWFLVGYWVWSILGALQAPDADLAWKFVSDTAKFLLPFVVGVTLIDSAKQLKQLAWTLILSQGYVALEMNLSYYGGYNRLQDIGFAGMDNNSVAIAMVAGCGLAMFVGIYAERMWQKLLAMLCAVLMAHCVMFAFSRGGMLGLIVIGAVMVVLLVRRPREFVIAGVILLFMLRLAGPDVRSRFFTTFADAETRDSSANSRLEQWGYCVDAMQDNPLFGVGPNHWRSVSAQLRQGTAVEAHSLWFQTGAQLGVPGLLLLVLFYGSCVVGMWPLANRVSQQQTTDERQWSGMAAGVMAGILGFCVSASFVSIEGLELPFYIVLLGAGILKLRAEKDNKRVVSMPVARPVLMSAR